MNTHPRTVGDVLRDWRHRRRLSQLDLASLADISARHLSFIETGRTHPSREMLVRLASSLTLPLRERNALLVAGGFAPLHPERSWSDRDLAAIRHAVNLVLTGHEPHPALALDRAWNLVQANRAAEFLFEGIAPELLTPPVNVFRLVVHPQGLAPRLLNLEDVCAVLLARLNHEIDLTGERRLEELRRELMTYPAVRTLRPGPVGSGGIVVPFVVQVDDTALRFISTTTVFGTATDVTVEELTIESFFPADERTALVLRSLQDR